MGISSARRCSRSARTRVTRASTGTSPSNDKFFGRYSFARYEDRRDEQPFPLFLTSRNDQPFYNIGFNWNRVIGSSMINELLVGYSNTNGHCSETLDWAGVGSRERDLRHCRRSADRRPLLDRVGQRAHRSRVRSRTDSDTLAKTYQINEKLTWLTRPARGEVRRTVAPLQPTALLCRQQRPARVHQLHRVLHGLRRSRTSCSIRCRPRAAAAAIRTIRGRTCRTGSRSSRRTISRSLLHLTLNLGLRWAYTSPLVEQDNRQSNFDLGHRPRRSSRRMAASKNARSTTRTTRASSRGSAPPGVSATNSSCAAPTASRSSWKARAPTCGFRSIRRSSSSRHAAFDSTTGPGRTGTGFAELVPGTTPVGERARLRP